MPILADYQPDLIINSAGQDNHYSDPLTNMNFTAQGYAILNKRLNPDIAVLEGGYSIQSALPYINLGIILAMAGLDFSHVVEPDFSAEKIKQNPKITKHIEQLSTYIYERWKNKDKLAKKAFANVDTVTKTNNIYYDTDGIMERQVQTFNICDKCASYNTIHSNSDKGDNILAITIPKKTCQTCQQAAYKLYNNSFRDKYTNIYLQDRIKDEYLSK